MHELSIAISILETVQKEAAKREKVRFLKVGLRIGELSGVDAESLKFGWDALTKDTDWQHLQLEVKTRPWVNTCSACATTFRVENYQTECPRCGSADTKLLSGDELDIAYIEIEENDLATGTD